MTVSLCQLTCQCISACLEIILSLLRSILWIVFSTVPALYGDEEDCVDLRKICLVMGIWSICGPFIKNISLKFIQTERVQNGIKLIYSLAELSIQIVIWVFLAEDEDCGKLRIFVWVWTWLIVAAVAIAIIATILIIILKLIQR